MHQPDTTQNKVLVDLAKSKHLSIGNIEGALKEITKAAAQTLAVEHVAVWLYGTDRKSLRCAKQYEKGPGLFSEGDELQVVRCPKYFETLENGRFIAVNDIRTDERTKDFLDNDPPSPDVSAMLDSPIRLGGRTIGVMCHWHVGESRQWSLEEKNFAGSMADLVSLAMEASERKRAEQRLSHLAYHEMLTDLPNRSLFMERLNRAIITARQKQSLVAVLFLGLDHFKRINDTGRLKEKTTCKNNAPNAECHIKLFRGQRQNN